MAFDTKRGAPSVEPHELKVITDPSDPLFDARIYLPLTDEAILNFAAVGQVQPIAIRTRGFDDLVVVDGLQRWKRATVINAICGKRRYDGTIEPVVAAIERLTMSGLDRRIIELCPSGVKLKVSLYRADDKISQLAKASANEFRVGDEVGEKARKAQQMSRHGIEDADIATAFGVTGQTVRRWLALDLDAPKERKKRGKATRPSRKTLAGLAVELAHVGCPSFAAIIEWSLGMRTDAELIDELPVFESTLKATKKAKATVDVRGLGKVATGPASEILNGSIDGGAE